MASTFNIPENIADQVAIDMQSLHMYFKKDMKFLYHVPPIVGATYDQIVKNILSAITKDILTPKDPGCCCCLFDCMFGWMMRNKDKDEAMYRYIKLIEQDDKDIEMDYIHGKTCFCNMVGQASTSPTSSFANKLAYAFYAIYKIMIFGRNLDTYDPQILADYHQMRLMVIRGTWLGNQLADYYLFTR